jgi:hypothetical protein
MNMPVARLAVAGTVPVTSACRKGMSVAGARSGTRVKIAKSVSAIVSIE